MSVKSAAAEAWISAIDQSYRLRNRRRPKVLVYTDSRGMNVLGRVRRSSLGSYVGHLQKHYAVTHRICPQKYTTLIDFLNFVDTRDLDQYAAVVVHCGIVDFSPRPLSNLLALRDGKRGLPRFDALFAANRDYHDAPFDTQYDGEPTTTVYSPEFARSVIVPELQRIPRLIWLTSNRFVPGWDGNYRKRRPANIGDTVARFDDVVARGLTNVIDLRRWSLDEVQQFTMDNIHFTDAGTELIAQLVDAEIESIRTAIAC